LNAALVGAKTVYSPVLSVSVRFAAVRASTRVENEPALAATSTMEFVVQVPGVAGALLAAADDVGVAESVVAASSIELQEARPKASAMLIPATAATLVVFILFNPRRLVAEFALKWA